MIINIIFRNSFQASFLCPLTTSLYKSLDFFLFSIFIILKSENINELGKNIIFQCSLFGKTIFYNPHIECSLKEAIPNLKVPFYLKKEHFKKSFQIKVNEKYESYILKINENIFYRGIIKNDKKK